MSGVNHTPSRTPKGYQPYLYNAYGAQFDAPGDQRLERKAIRDIRDLQEMNRRAPGPQYGVVGVDDDSEEGVPLSPLPHQSQGDWKQKMCLRVIVGSAATVASVIMIFVFWLYLWSYFV